MNHRVPSDSIERGWSLASSVCRNVPPRYAVHTFAPRPTRARNKTAFLTRTEIARPFRVEMNNAAPQSVPRPTSTTSVRIPASRWLLSVWASSQAAFARIVPDTNPPPTTGKTPIPIARKMRRPARNACSDERINPATKNTRPNSNPMSWNVIENQVRFNRDHVPNLAAT